MAATNRLSLLVQTYGGITAKIAVCVAAAVVDPSGAVVASLRAAYAQISAALAYKASMKKSANNTDTPTNAPYEDVKDKMVLRFKDANGNLHKYKFPSPKESCFLAANKNKVDPADTATAALISHFLALVKTKGGEPLVSYVGGTRERVKRKKA